MAEPTGFAVIDLETTGLYPNSGDRIVEIGIVGLDAWLRPQGEWSTLVNPHRDVGPTSIHGITAGEVRDAPTFEEVAGDVAGCVGDRMIVGHNVRFDLSFMAAEYKRAGFPVQWVPGLDTMWLAYSVTGHRKLVDCCRSLHIDVGRSHSAICDARSTAALLGCCLRQLRATPPTFPPPQPRWTLPGVAPSGKRRVRGEVARPPETSLASLVTRIPVETRGTTAPPEAIIAYVDLLDRALEDRRLTAEEVDALGALAAEWQIGSADVFAIHRSYFNGLARLALADGVLTPLERSDLAAIAGLLGVPDALKDLTTAATGQFIAVDRTEQLRGNTVCFTGESVCKLHGRPLDRATQHQLAAAAGLIPVETVTKALDLLVVADPASDSGKAKKADAYGIRKMAERAFWSDLKVRVDG
jgi:DNA polymerase-3 subunit epsilon